MTGLTDRFSQVVKSFNRSDGLAEQVTAASPWADDDELPLSQPSLNTPPPQPTWADEPIQTEAVHVPDDAQTPPGAIPEQTVVYPQPVEQVAPQAEQATQVKQAATWPKQTVIRQHARPQEFLGQGYLRRFQCFFSAPLAAALILGLLLGSFAHLSLIVALTYPLLVACYLHWREYWSKVTITALMLVVVSPIASVVFDPNGSLFLIMCSFLVSCLEPRRELRRLHSLHGYFASFCFGIIVIGLRFNG